MNTKTKKILIIGAAHSGTSALASYFGAHPDVAMLCEDNGDKITSIIGKKYAGNKLLVYRQIRYDKRGHRFGYAINKIVNLFCAGINKFELFPMSKLSISDYIQMGAIIIVIKRGRENNIESIIQRQGFSRKNAEKMLDNGEAELLKIKSHYYVVNYDDLKNSPRTTLSSLCEKLGIEFNPEMIINGLEYNWVYYDYKETLDI